jgi:predicted nucleic acid-binding Zn ribbon protein
MFLMQRLQIAAARALQHLLAQQPTTPAKVSCAWRIAAGPALGRAATPHWTDDGTLSVHARDAAWLAEIRRARPIIAQRLAQLLGPDVVRRFVIESGD